MEIVKDDVTGDLYKNGEKYQRINMTNSNENNQDTRSESKSGFSFHAKGTDVHSSDVLISSRTNSETHKEVSTSGADFKYHANGDVEYSVITTNRSEGSRSRMSPDYNDRVEQARRQKNSNVNLKDKTQNSKTISLSSLQQIKPPSRPVTKGKVSVNQDQNSKDKPVSRQSDWTKDDKSRTTSPERQGALKTPSSQNKTRQNDPKSNIGKDRITSKRTASPEKGILKKPVSPRKPGDSTDNTKQKDVTTENVDAIIVKESIARTVTNQTNATYISEERLHKDSSETNNGNNSSTQEVTPEDKVQNEEHVNGYG
jgi:hypothetical protein